MEALVLIALLPFLLQYTLGLNYVDCALHLLLSNERSLFAIYIMSLENSVYHILVDDKAKILPCNKTKNFV